MASGRNITEHLIDPAQDANLRRCLAARQWQNAAAMLGCSVDTVRREHDRTYLRDAPPVAEPPVAVAPAPTAASQRWPVLDHALKKAIRQRLRPCGLNVKILAERMGKTANTMSSYLSPAGQLPAGLADQIKAEIEAAEALDPEKRSEWRQPPGGKSSYRARMERLGLGWQELAGLTGYSWLTLRAKLCTEKPVTGTMMERVEKALASLERRAA